MMIIILLKIHDFFGVNGGPFEDKTKVKTTGFHIIEGINYSLFKSKKNKLILKCGAIIDLNFFNKKITFLSYDTKSDYTKKEKQLRLGIGPELIFKFKLYKNIYFEVRNLFVFNTFTYKNNKETKKIKPYKSLWFNKTQNKWFISIFNLSYEF